MSNSPSPDPAALDATLTLDEMTLDELRPRLVAEMLADVPFDGWRAATARQAASRLGLSPDLVSLAFPEAIDMVDCWAKLLDEKMRAACAGPEYAAARIRDKIGGAIRARLAASPRETVRQASLVLGQPRNLLRAGRLAWRTADAIWRLAGDSSTDFAFYSKRLTVASLYTSVVLVYIGDDTADHSETFGFLERRIANVMQFEAAKARWRKQAGPAGGFSLSRFLGRLRYPVEPL